MNVQMITVSELFPLYSTCSKWMGVFRGVSISENVRLEKEYTIVQYAKDMERWTIDGRYHRRDGPARIIFYVSLGCIIKSVAFFIHGQFLIDGDKPSSISYFENGTIASKIWRTLPNSCMIHRENGPAWIIYDEDGSILREEWWINGKLTQCNDN